MGKFRKYFMNILSFAVYANTMLDTLVTVSNDILYTPLLALSA